MRAARMMTRPCEVVTVSEGSGPEDDMGEVERVETRVSTVCELQQSDAKETRDGGIIDVQAWDLFLPPRTVIATTSEVVVEGRAYSVEGGPWLVRHPRTGEPSHIEANVRLVS